MPGIHREERDPRQGAAHLIGVIGGDAGGAEFLEIEGFEVDQMLQGAGQAGERLAGPDQLAFAII
jgi:hypothetical protein